jgi:hypothetical protein
VNSGEHARPACWRRRPAFANFRGRPNRSARAITPHAAGSSFWRDAETSTRDARAPHARTTPRQRTRAQPDCLPTRIAHWRVRR